MITDIPPGLGLPSARQLDATNGDALLFESPVTWVDDFMNSTAGARERILANFRVLARTNAILRAAVEDDAESN